jgi:hypothetical protein
MNLSTKITKIAITGLAALALTACGSRVVANGDLTGDGIPDQIVVKDLGNRYLMVGQPDGTYLECSEFPTIPDVTAYSCPGGTKYVWSPKYNLFVQAGEYKP